MDSPDPLTVGQTLAYTITVTNNGPASATGVAATITLPQGVMLDSKPPQCTGTSTVTCNLGTLASRAATSVTITSVPTVANTVSTTVSVVAIEPDPNPANDTDAEATVVQPPSQAQADLAITATAEPAPGASGQALTYTLAVRNRGPATATGVQVTDILPQGVVLTSKPSECEGSTTVICNLGTLPRDEETTVPIEVIPRTAGTLIHSPRVAGTASNPDPGNNAFSIITTIEPPLEPASPATCSTLLCRLRLACNQAQSLGENCENEVTLFVNVPRERVSEELSARGPRRVRVAATAEAPRGPRPADGFGRDPRRG